METTKDTHLIPVIKEDCKLWEKLNNRDKMFESTLYLYTYGNSEGNGMYGLYLNGSELWYGTLREINAVVKSMCKRIEHNDYLN